VLQLVLNPYFLITFLADLLQLMLQSSDSLVSLFELPTKSYFKPFDLLLSLAFFCLTVLQDGLLVGLIDIFSFNLIVTGIDVVGIFVCGSASLMILVSHKEDYYDA